MKADLIDKSEDPESNVQLFIFVRDLSDIRTVLYDYPNMNTNEEVAKKNWYSIKEGKGIISWFLEALKQFKVISKISLVVSMYQYPRLSNFSLALLLLIVYFYESSLTLTYGFLLSIIFLTYFSLPFQSKIHPIIKVYLTGKQHSFFSEKPCVKILTKDKLG